MGIAPSIKLCFLAAILYTITSHPDWPVSMTLHLYCYEHLAQGEMAALFVQGWRTGCIHTAGPCSHHLMLSQSVPAEPPWPWHYYLHVVFPPVSLISLLCRLYWSFYQSTIFWHRTKSTWYMNGDAASHFIQSKRPTSIVLENNAGLGES